MAIIIAIKKNIEKNGSVIQPDGFTKICGKNTGI
jgi:hypothetical protein